MIRDDRGNVAAPVTGRSINPDIRVLTPGDVGSLRLHWDARFSIGELREIAGSAENISVWNQRTGEYLVGGPWRHRREIATILELGGTAGAVDLIDGFAAACREHGVQLIIASEQAERRRREFYESAGMGLVEDIIVYELGHVRRRTPALDGLRFEFCDLADEHMFAQLLELDHAAFPWLWWNSRDEFIDYAGTPGVQIQAGFDDSGQMVTYIGTTRFRSWGHLDRIAVSPDIQGRGYGRMSLDYAVTWLANSGARRIGLSTQSSNTRSRTLYEAYGFRRATSHDYRLYGRELATRADDHAEESE